MKFGKLANVDKIEFSLPPEPEESLAYLHSLPKTSALKIYVGAPAWGRKEWKGKIYPETLNSEEFLKYYAKSYNSIELNTTHYRMPKKDEIFEWFKEVDNGFMFCPKFPQTISHFGGLTVKEKVSEFIEVISCFGEHLGLPFIQLHENFSSKRFGDLVKFVSNLDAYKNVAVELRHADWFKDEGIFKYLRSKELSSVISDVSGRRDVLHMNITSPSVMIRFVGNNLHPSDYTRLDEWVNKIKEWSNTGLKEVYFFLHEPDDVSCPEIADYFINQLKKAGLTTTAQMQFIKSDELSFGL